MAKKQTREQRAEAAGVKSLKACPFCGYCPVATPWHGGKPTKVMVMCRAINCHVGPQVTGETFAAAARRWNGREVNTNLFTVKVHPDF